MHTARQTAEKAHDSIGIYYRQHGWKAVKRSLILNKELDLHELFGDRCHKFMVLPFNVTVSANVSGVNRTISRRLEDFNPETFAFFKNHGEDIFGTYISIVQVEKRSQEMALYNVQQSLDTIMNRVGPELDRLRKLLKSSVDKAAIARQMCDLQGEVSSQESIKRAIEDKGKKLLQLIEKLEEPSKQKAYIYALKENIQNVRRVFRDYFGSGIRDDIIADFLWIDGATFSS